MAEKDTLTRLKIDLQCSKDTKKVKEVLCEFPVRGQWIDDKNNIVTIDVVCCSPEKIRDEICRKGGRAIKSIKIVEPPKKPDAGYKKIVAHKPKGGGERDKKIVAHKPKGGGEGDKKIVAHNPKGGGGEGDKKIVAHKPKGGGGEGDKKKVAKDPGQIPLQLPAMPMPKMNIYINTKEVIFN